MVVYSQTLPFGIRGLGAVQLVGKDCSDEEFLDSGHVQNHVEEHESKEAK